jgi:GntR family negative regulator for fad regulon and positive regulator of fabA
MIVVSALVKSRRGLLVNFIPNLLTVRLALAPAYTQAAIENDPTAVIACLKEAASLEDTAEVYAVFDWELHRCLTLASANPIYTLILNGFTGFYENMAQRYFAEQAARLASQAFYLALLASAGRGDASKAAEITRQVMQQSLEIWLGRG